MSTGTQRRTRSDLVAALPLPPGQAARVLESLRRRDVLARIGLCLLAALAMWATTGAWDPPFPYRFGDTPPRDIVTRTPFSVQDEEETKRLRGQARSETLCIYKHDKQPLVELRRALKDSVIRIISAESFAELDEEGRNTWAEFLNEDEARSLQNSEETFFAFRAALSEDKERSKFEKAIEGAFADYERQGLLVALEHDLPDGRQTAILVHDLGKESSTQRFEVTDVRIADAMVNLPQKLSEQLTGEELPEEHVPTVAQLVFQWLSNKKLPATLRLNDEASEQARQDEEQKVPEATQDYQPGAVLAVGGIPLSTSEMFLLRREYETAIEQMSLWEKAQHSLADLGLYVAIYTLCGMYIFLHEPRVLASFRRFATLLGLIAATVMLCAFDHNFQWRAGTIPVILFGITIAIAYQRELSLLLTSSVAFIVTLSLGQGLGELVVLVAAVSACVVLVGRIRNRTKLIYVGLGTGVVAALATVGVGTLLGQTFGWSGIGQIPFNELDRWLHDSFQLRLIMGALWLGLCCLMAGVLMTGLLPFIEKLLDVQTDLSLLELGDAAHPLLQQLVQRAPGTYNHSITVASIAEAAAEAIGANGLLVRVGSYFHDIGKMLKPGYFVENQSSGDNRHDSLMPAMSTLVIIAHVKDGADLARQHRLPQSIIDFVEQHHGTTLVEYFYDQATKKSEEDPDSCDVDETSFRYPGPKPQSLESAVLMLADAAESACRTLVDPAPARIGQLVHELSMKRLLDGQFDECALTFKDLRTIEDSLVKSLTAVYHGRVKYPSQQPA